VSLPLKYVDFIVTVDLWCGNFPMKTNGSGLLLCKYSLLVYSSGIAFTDQAKMFSC